MKRVIAAVILVLASACGEEQRAAPGTPTGPSAPIPPPGTTWSIRGTVTDSLLVLPNARVEIVAGTGVGTWTTSGPGGAYELGGVSGDVEVRASLPGSESQVRRVRVSSDQANINFALVPMNPANVGGAWRLTMEASNGCNTLLDSVRLRTYQAVVHQSGARAIVEFADDKVVASDIEAVIYETSVRVVIGLNDYDPKDGFRERIVADTVLAVVGWVPQAALTQTRISGLLHGYIATYQVPIDARLEDLLRLGPITSSCSAADHRFTLER